MHVSWQGLAHQQPLAMGSEHPLKLKRLLSMSSDIILQAPVVSLLLPSLQPRTLILETPGESSPAAEGICKTLNKHQYDDPTHGTPGPNQDRPPAGQKQVEISHVTYLCVPKNSSKPTEGRLHLQCTAVERSTTRIPGHTTSLWEKHMKYIDGDTRTSRRPDQATSDMARAREAGCDANTASARGVVCSTGLPGLDALRGSSCMCRPPVFWKLSVMS
jgi:hypothetical protein